MNPSLPNPINIKSLLFSKYILIFFMLSNFQIFLSIHLYADLILSGKVYSFNLFKNLAILDEEK